MVFGKMRDTADGNFSQIFLAPFAIGFSLFLFGSIAKKLIAEGADAWSAVATIIPNILLATCGFAVTLTAV
jgi:hypothetical protein